MESEILMMVSEFKNMNVKIRGYAMPDDNAPDFYTRCKLSEALEIMKKVASDFPKEFSKLTFEIYTEDETGIFAIHRDFKEIYLGDNYFELTKDMVKEVLGMSTESL